LATENCSSDVSAKNISTWRRHWALSAIGAIFDVRENRDVQSPNSLTSGIIGGFLKAEA